MTGGPLEALRLGRGLRLRIVPVRPLDAAQASFVYKRLSARAAAVTR